MRISRFIIHAACTAALLSALGFTGAALAQAYPSKPVQFVIPYPPGGASDLIARVLSEKLAADYGQPFVVLNKGGANGNIATEFVAKSPADGYTILMGNIGPNAINPALYANAKFDPLKSFEPIVQTGNVPMVLVANAALPVSNTRELIEYVRAQKQPMLFATGGNGAATHLASALLELSAKIKLTHVQYKGDSYSLTDIAGGQIPVGLVTLPALTPFLNNPKIKLLGVTTAQRTAKLPSVPTFAESGVAGYDSSSWGGVLAPAGTPVAIVTSLNEHLVKIRNSQGGRTHACACAHEYSSQKRSRLTP
jgi:tripartite-type tricarboxylate transporter receptor subunit TctC